jgi:fatty acid synthase subunit alpha
MPTPFAGIPEDIIRQVDRTSLWALVCVAEALMMSGITDAYELFKYVHPSEVGSALGSGMGGMQRCARSSDFVPARSDPAQSEQDVP